MYVFYIEAANLSEHPNPTHVVGACDSQVFGGEKRSPEQEELARAELQEFLDRHHKATEAPPVLQFFFVFWIVFFLFYLGSGDKN